MKLDVMHIMQEKQMSCWHASARMLYGYRNSACINPLPDDYEDNQGITAEEFINLAHDIGLETLPQVNQTFSWLFINDNLMSYGPMWAAGQWNGVNHIIVVSGVDEDGTLYVNDPAFGSPVVRNMSWLNARIDKNVAIPMMYLP
jgi:ABC-type bacteriocin/lantibiotic exporter with double-glycine peptidase domain